MLIKLIIGLLALTVFVSGRRKDRDGATLDIEGNINQPIEILFPFKHVLQVHIDNQNYANLIHFSPNRFRLKTIKQSLPLPSKAKDLLEQLRTPFSNQYSHLFNINQHLIAFRFPNSFTVLKQTENQLLFVNTFTIKEMLQHQVMFKTVGDKYIFIFVDQQIILLNESNYFIQENPFNTTQVKLSFISFKVQAVQFICEFDNQLSFGVIDKKQIFLSEIVSRNQSSSFFGNSSVDCMQIGRFDGLMRQIWFLDSSKGLYLILLSVKNEILDIPHLILEQQDCGYMNLQQRSNLSILLTCNFNGQSTFIRLIIDNKNIQKPIILIRQNPYFQTCHTKKYMHFQQYILSLQKQSIDIYMPISSKDKPITYVKNWMSLPSASAYILFNHSQDTNLSVYKISNNKVQKQLILLQDYTFQVKSSQIVQTNIDVNLSHICEHTNTTKLQICHLQVNLKINIHDAIMSYVQLKSINIAVMLLFFTSLIALIMLCYYKYKKLQHKVLQQLKSITNPTHYQL